jgi:hypothetical protein
VRDACGRRPSWGALSSKMSEDSGLNGCAGSFTTSSARNVMRLQCAWGSMTPRPSIAMRQRRKRRGCREPVRSRSSCGRRAPRRRNRLANLLAT